MTYFNPGELRTKIRIQQDMSTVESGGFKKPCWVDLGNQSPDDPPKIIRAKWIDIHGQEAIVAASLQSLVIATVTVRYNPDISEACRIIKYDSGLIYEIVSMDDVEQRHRYLVIQVKASVND